MIAIGEIGSPLVVEQGVNNSPNRRPLPIHPAMLGKQYIKNDTPLEVCYYYLLLTTY